MDVFHSSRGVRFPQTSAEPVRPISGDAEATAPPRTGLRDGLKRLQAEGFRYVLLFVLVACGLALRLYGIDWDQGHFFHPDERFLLLLKLPELGALPPNDWGLFLDPAKSPWDPRWFAYGSFPLYLLKLLSQMATAVVSPFPLDDLRFLGRGLSALADVGTVLLVYLLGARLYGWRTGLLAATFTTFAVVHIQLSHFAAFDVLLTFLVLLTLYGAVRVMERGDVPGGLLVGVGVGLGLATKVSIAPILVPVAVAYFLYGFSSRYERLTPSVSDGARQRQVFRSLAFAVGTALAAFLVTQPYALLDWGTFLRDAREQSEMVLRIRDYPFTRQYEGTPPYLYPIQQLAIWGLGWPLGVVAWLGLFFTVGRACLRREKGDILLLSWVLPYFLVTGAFPVKFLRYLLPVAPVLVLMGSHMLVLWQERMAQRRRPLAPAQPTVDLAAGSLGRAAPVGAASFRFRSAVARFPTKGAITYAPELALGLVLLFTLWYALAFTAIYREAHPAVRLSAWINEHVPKGQLILKEHWEEGVPRLEGYRQGELGLYEPDDARKLAQLAQQLQAADYLIFYSNRLYGTIPRLPQRYPMSSRYYQLLFSGQLGYELVHTTAAYPSLLGVTWVDDTFDRPGLPVPRGAEAPSSGLVVRQGYADESFTVYDHPRTLLFKKAQPLSAGELEALLRQGLPGGQGGAAASPPGPPAGQVGLSSASGASGAGLLLSERDSAAQRAGGTWSELFQRDSLANRLPLLIWLFAVESIGLCAFPLAFRLFSAFPDRGFLLAKGLGLLLVAYGTWLAASLHLLPFGRGTLFLAVALLAGLGLYSLRRGATFWPFVLARWRSLLALEGLFLVAFFIFYFIRLANPDLWHPWRGGEKPMDFAYLNAVVKSTYMPPYDPWFSGGYINYYYFGQFLVATLVKLTGVLPAVAYNLAIPTLFALFVGNAFSIGAALVAAAMGLSQPSLRQTGRAAPSSALTQEEAGVKGASLQPRVNPRGAPSVPGFLTSTVSWWRLWAAGGTTALMVAVLGNLDGAAQVLEGLQKVSNLHLQSTLPGLAGLVASLAGVFRVVVEGAPLPAFDFWRPSRMMPPAISITEFPFFTFLFADLHAHLIALPFVLLATALAGQLALAGRTQGFRERLGHLVVLGLVLGAIRWTNSWDYPTTLVVGGLGLLIGEVSGRRKLAGWLVLKVGIQALVLLACSVLLFQPLQASYQLFYAGVTPSPETTPVHQYLLVHGLFLAVLGGFLVYEVRQRFGWLGMLRVLGLLWRRRSAFGQAWALYRRLARRPDRPSRVAGAYLFTTALVALLVFGIGLSTIAFLLLLLGILAPLVVAEVLRPTQRGPGYLFALGLVCVAALLGLFVEVLTLQGDIQRMNTVFKFYLQAWVLYGIAAAYALWWILGRPGVSDGRGFGALGRPARWWSMAVGLLFLGGLVYPLLAIPVRLADRFTDVPRTEDGMAYMAQAVYREEKGTMELRWDYEAIRWLQDHVKGSPVVLEGVTPIYHWGSRVSVYTGLPTVLGWDWHQTQQRWGYRDQIETRKQDVATLYSTSDQAQTRELLRRYHIAYVYVGPLERLYYPAAGLSKFEAMAAQGTLQKVFQSEQVTIYAVMS